MGGIRVLHPKTANNARGGHTLHTVAGISGTYTRFGGWSKRPDSLYRIASSSFKTEAYKDQNTTDVLVHARSTQHTMITRMCVHAYVSHMSVICVYATTPHTHTVTMVCMLAGGPKERLRYVAISRTVLPPPSHPAISRSYARHTNTTIN